MIVKFKNKYFLLSKTTGKVLGVHDTKEGALKQERAIQINKKKK